MKMPLLSTKSRNFATNKQETRHNKNIARVTHNIKTSNDI